MRSEGKREKRRLTISRAFLRWLLSIVAVGFLASMLFTWIHQTGTSNNNAVTLLRINVQDVRQDVIDASDENLLKLTREIAAELNSSVRVNSDTLKQMLQIHDVAEINLIDRSGIITATTMDEFQDYDMRSGKQSAEFMTLLETDTKEYVQSYQPTSSDPSLFRKYAAVTLRAGGFVQVGYDGERFRRDIDQYVINAAKNRHVGQTGCIIIANEEWNIVSDRYGLAGSNLAETGIWIDRPTMPENEVFRAQVYGEDCSCTYIFTEGYYIIAVLPENEIILERDSSLRMMGIMEILLFLVLFTAIFLLVKYLVLDNLGKVNTSLSRISDGDLDEVVDVRSNAEFSDLSDDINSTVGTLKQYIADAAARIDEELALAKDIQESALPSVFPPYPDRPEFSLYADMETAREVGGDFYDFYLLDENRLAFLVADVSGKGIPAAMFMMTAKTVLRDYAERGDSPKDVFTNANAQLCGGNDADMFLTAWMGFLETDTGRLRFVNAGHNPPVLIRKGKSVFIEQKPNLMLAMAEGMVYREEQMQLEPGDMLYLYTDGVTEASAADRQRFGNARLLEILSGRAGDGDAACRETCDAVRKAVEAFAGDAPQFDDITQLCLFYRGAQPEESAGGNCRELTVDAREENLPEVLAFVRACLDETECGEKERKQTGMAAEEIFMNIAGYAYPDKDGGTVHIAAETGRDEIRITFTDSGVPYNPLEKPDPDLAMDIEEREHGGFGIYMVKQAMDEVSYHREDGYNILTVRKKRAGR